MKKKLPVREYILLDETVSTNNDLKNGLRSGEISPLSVISAKRQSGGRGRLGREFVSPPGGVYFSASYPLTGREKNIPFLTLAAGLAAAEAIEENTDEITAARIKIKWPNDIYIGGKKVCGILTELTSCKSGLAAVVGVGINCAPVRDACPAELADKITSLGEEGISFEKEKLVRTITEKLDTFVYSLGVLDGAPTEFTDAINSRSYLKGKKIAFDNGSQRCEGVADSVLPDGSLLALTDSGSTAIKFGEVVAVGSN